MKYAVDKVEDDIILLHDASETSVQKDPESLYAR